MQVDSSSDQFQLLSSRRDKCTWAWLNSVRNWPTAPGISNTVRVLMCTETCRIPILYSQRRLLPGWKTADHVLSMWSILVKGNQILIANIWRSVPWGAQAEYSPASLVGFQPRALWCTESNDFLPPLSLINKTLLSIYLYLLSPALRFMGACRNLCQLS